MISQTASALVLGFFIATAYGAGFHLLMGGGARRLLLYVGASWLGFSIGHLVGDVLNITLLKTFFWIGYIRCFAFDKNISNEFINSITVITEDVNVKNLIGNLPKVNIINTKLKPLTLFA